MKRVLLLVMVCMGLLVGFRSYSQETNGGLTGKILDATGQPMPGATVEAIHIPSGTHYATASGSDGRYNLPGMRIGGPYKITISAIGMTTLKRENVAISLGSLSNVNFVLTDNTKQLSEVVIKASRSGAKANRTGAGTNISGSQVRNLPTIGRSLQDFTRLTPQGSKDNSFGGTNFRYNNVTIDGAINNDAIGFSPSLGGQSGTSGQPGSSTRSTPISLDAIQDIQVYLAPYDVKIGNFTGGSVNAVTRSGTNDVTGSVYAFGRNASITGAHDAVNNATSKEPSAFHDYTLGVRLGFPIIKNKLFFFSNEEFARRQDPILLNASNDPNVITPQIAQVLTDTLKKIGINPGSYGAYNIYSRSNKFFNRLDWNISPRTQLVLRNNTITSQATNLERDAANFRFGSIDYQQVNNQSSTVAELKTRFNNSLSNSLVVGYSAVHDFRNPTSDVSLPQMEIVGAKPGTTIFIGTDREGAIFNMKQKTFEFTDNLTFYKGRHTITVGTHNELYNITYDFVNSWNGRLAYNSLVGKGATDPAALGGIGAGTGSLLSLLNRARGAYNYTNDSRDYIEANPSAQFKVNMFSLYGQDEYQVSDRFKLTLGLRFDMADVPNKQPLSSKTTSTPADANYGTTYSYTQPRNILNKYMGQVQISPRLGFNYDVNGDKSLIIRGGSGLFTGRIPFAWMGYAFYNNGNTYGFFDQKYAGTTRPVGDPLAGHPSANGIGGFIANQPKASSAKTEVDMIDNHFKMPKVWRSSLAVDYTTADGYKFSVEGIYTKTINDLVFRNVNIKDSASYYAYDTRHQQPIFVSGSKGSNNTGFTSNYLLSNTNQGYRYSLTAQVGKSPSGNGGLNWNVAYTYGQSKDVTNGIRNSMESNWQLNQALNPNSPGLANSNFDVRQRIVLTIGYALHWNESNTTNLNLFYSGQSGSPFSYGFVGSTVDNSGQQVSLAYIPKLTETASFFAANPAMAAAFDQYVNSNSYLNSRRGNFTERNTGRTPWNNQLDFRLSHDIHVGASKKNTITLTYDVINLANLIDKNLGKVFYVNNTYNSTASIGLAAAKGTAAFPAVINGIPQYTWSSPATPWQVDPFLSRWQMQFGVRYSF